MNKFLIVAAITCLATLESHAGCNVGEVGQGQTQVYCCKKSGGGTYSNSATCASACCSVDSLAAAACKDGVGVAEWSLNACGTQTVKPPKNKVPTSLSAPKSINAKPQKTKAQ